MKVLQLLRGISLPLMAILCMLAASCGDQPTDTDPKEKVTVSGILKDEGGFIIPGASVQAFDAANIRLSADSSDESGMFALSDLPENLAGVQLRVVHGDFKPFSASADAIVRVAGGREGVIMQLAHNDSCCARLLLSVADGDRRPLAGVEIKLRRGKNLISAGTSDSNGQATFLNVCGGEYNVRLAKGGYDVVERDGITIRGCDTTRMELAMRSKGKDDDSCCNARSTIIIRDSATNTVIDGATVKLWKGNTLLSTRTATNGRVDYTGLCKGDYVADVSYQGYKRQEFRFTLECNGRIEITRKLVAERSDSCCNGRLEVVVRDSASNAPVANALVKLWKGKTLLTSRQTNASGIAVFEGLCAGSYGVNLSREGYLSREFEIGVECNARVETTRKLLAKKSDSVCCTAKFIFKTKDSTTSSMISGVHVRIMRGNTLVAEGETNGEGRYLREGICGNESYTVTFSRDGYASKTFTFRINECRVLEETIWLMPD